MDIMTLSQSSPGPIAVNSSLLIGYKLGGIFGGLVSMLGTITPPVVILTVISMLYSSVSNNAVLEAIMHGMQAGITAIICDVVMSLTLVVKREKNYYGIITLPVTFALVFFVKEPNIILYVILSAFAFGIIVTLIERKIAMTKEKKKLFLDNSSSENNQKSKTKTALNNENIEESDIKNQSNNSEIIEPNNETPSQDSVLIGAITTSESQDKKEEK